MFRRSIVLMWHMCLGRAKLGWIDWYIYPDLQFFEQYSMEE
jgi:hypothetical protein